MTQFYKLTLDRAIADYQNGLIRATGLLYFYLQIHFSGQEKFELDRDRVCQELGISKAQFYRSLKKLETRGFKVTSSTQQSSTQLIYWEKN